MSKMLQVGVISCAGMARTHMRAVVDHPSACLAAVCDIDEKRMQDAAREYNVPQTYADYRQMLTTAGLDAVIVVTPDQVHREMTVAALEAGLHVLCEKPMALTLEDCRAMVNAAERSDKKVMVGQISRYAPGFVKAKALIDAGEIGELFFVESEYAHDYSERNAGWRLDPLRHGMLGGGCHAMDLLRWVAGDPNEVSAYANHKMLTDWPTDDCTIAIMKFPNNVIGKVFVSTGCKRNYTMRSVFYGTLGTIIVDNTSPTMQVFKTGIKDSLFADMKQDFTAAVEYPIKIKNHNTIREFAEFAEIILNDLPVSTTAREGAKTVAACLAAVESARIGRPVQPDYNF